VTHLLAASGTGPYLSATGTFKVVHITGNPHDAEDRGIRDGDLVTLREELAREEADEAAARFRRAGVEGALDAARARQAGLEQQLDATTPRLAAAQDTWYRLSALAERLRGTVQLAEQRVRHLSAPVEAHRPGRDPDELEREAAAVEASEAQLHAVEGRGNDGRGDSRPGHGERERGGGGGIGSSDGGR